VEKVFISKQKFSTFFLPKCFITFNNVYKMPLTRLDTLSHVVQKYSFNKSYVIIPLHSYVTINYCFTKKKNFTQKNKNLILFSHFCPEIGILNTFIHNLDPVKLYFKYPFLIIIVYHTAQFGLSKCSAKPQN